MVWSIPRQRRQKIPVKRGVGRRRTHCRKEFKMVGNSRKKRRGEHCH
jgi:hypothetical protein